VGLVNTLKERENIPDAARSRLICPFCGRVWTLSGENSILIAGTERIVCPGCNKTILVKARPRVRKHILAI